MPVQMSPGTGKTAFFESMTHQKILGEICLLFRECIDRHAQGGVRQTVSGTAAANSANRPKPRRKDPLSGCD